MKKRILLSIFLAVLISSISANSSDISGQWLMTKAVFDGNTDEVYQPLNFREDGSAEMAGIVFGSWKSNGENKTITIESEMIDEFAGTWQISSTSEHDITLSSNSRSLFLTEFNPDKIEKENRTSNLEGVWKLDNKDDEDADIFLYFKTPDELLIYLSGEGFTGKGSGTWIFNKKDNSIVMMAAEQLIRGKNTIISITDNDFILKNKGIEITGHRLEQNGKTREQLPLSENNNNLMTIAQNDEVTNLNRENFSWFNLEAKSSYLKNVTELKYTKSTLIDNFDIFSTEDIAAKVSYNEHNGSIIIDTIFEELPSEEYSENNTFYPLEEPFIYTVVGEKEITVPAGTFKCMVIDTDDYYMSNRTRLYMIKNRPGIYAKIINISEHFDEETYTMYELIDIEGDFNNQNNDKITGEWFLIEMESNGEINKMSTNFEFINDGRISIDQSGYISYYKWSFNEDENSIILGLNNGDQKLNIEVLTDSKMQLKNNELSYSFIKMDTGLAVLSEEDNRVAGYWMLTNSSYPYRLIHLTDDHSVYDIERIIRTPIDENYSSLQGKWMYNNTDKTLIFNTDAYEAICSGSLGVRKLTDTIMILDDQGYQLVFIKIDPESIAENNKESGIEGLWKIKGQNGTTNYYDFSDPLLFRKGSSIESMPKSGLWFYNPETKIIFLGYQMHQLEGLTTIKDITENTIVFENGLVAERVR